MDTLNIDATPLKKRRPPLAAQLWNLMSLLALLGMLGSLGAFWVIFNNPYSAWNPFPPPTLPAALGFPIDTPTPIGMLPPTWTPAPTQPPTPTETARPTATLPPTPTFFSLLTATPAPLTTTGPGAASGYAYVVKERPLPLPNIAHSDKGCNWMGVAGTVEDLRGGPKTQLIVVLGGSLGGRLVDRSGVKYSLTGVAPAYGPAGYEFVLADKPASSKATLWIQLVDQTEAPLSEKVYFDTFDDCEKNLIVLSFKQVR